MFDVGARPLRKSSSSRDDGTETPFYNFFRHFFYFTLRQHRVHVTTADDDAVCRRKSAKTISRPERVNILCVARCYELYR